MTTPAPTTALSTVATGHEIIGVVESLNLVARTFVLKRSQGAGGVETVAYRDDTKFETALGGSMRFDEFTESSGGKLPLSTGDKVRITWRMSSDGKNLIALTLRTMP